MKRKRSFRSVLLGFTALCGARCAPYVCRLNNKVPGGVMGKIHRGTARGLRTGCLASRFSGWHRVHKIFQSLGLPRLSLQVLTSRNVMPQLTFLLSASSFSSEVGRNKHSALRRTNPFHLNSFRHYRIRLMRLRVLLLRVKGNGAQCAPRLASQARDAVVGSDLQLRAAARLGGRRAPRIAAFFQIDAILLERFLHRAADGRLE